MYEIFIILEKMSFEYVICNLSASQNIVSSSKGFNEVEGVLNDSRLDGSNHDAPVSRPDASASDSLELPSVFASVFIFKKNTLPINPPYKH